MIICLAASPTFLIRPKDQLVAVGRTVTLQCVVTGNPAPTVFWSKGAQEVSKTLHLAINRSNIDQLYSKSTMK